MMNRVVAALLACSSLSNGAIAARPEVGPDPNNETQVLGKRVSGFRVQGLPLVDALIQLGMATGQPMGIEYVDLESLEKPTSFSLDHGTLGEGLRLILAGRKSYTWRVENAVLVVTNAFVRMGRANLLHRVLPAFSIPRCTLQEASHELEMDLTQQLHPGMGIIGDYNPGLKGLTVGPLEMKDVTVRQALDRLVEAAGQAAWVVQVLPRESDQAPSYGFWRVVEYNDGATVGRVGELILRVMYPVGSPPSYAKPGDKP